MLVVIGYKINLNLSLLYNLGLLLNMNNYRVVEVK